MSPLLRSASVLALALAALAARAQNLVSNGGFEDSQLSSIPGWTVTLPASSGSAGNYPALTGASPYGQRFVILDPGYTAPTGSITQDFATAPAVGQTYAVSFAYKQVGGVANSQSLLVTINSTSLPLTPSAFAAAPSTDLSTWQRGFFQFTQTGAALYSGITFANPSSSGSFTSDLLVDDVSVVAVSPVPEPTPLAALGLGAVAVLRRRRKG